MIKTNKFSVVNFLILLTIVFGGSSVFIGCGSNDQPFFETIDDQTLAIDVRRTVEIHIRDSDKKDMHTVRASSANNRIATVVVNDRSIDPIGIADFTIEGVSEGRTYITVSATDDSGEDNATFDQEFMVTVVKPELIVSIPSQLKESTLDGSEVSLSVIGLTFDQGIQSSDVSISGIEGVYSYPTRISDTEANVVLNLDSCHGISTDSFLNLTVSPGAFAEDYNGPSFTTELFVVSDLDLREDSYYDHIVGPWLWMIAPGGSINLDNLSVASQGAITENQIAQNGVSEGEHFNALKWTRGHLLPTTVCGIFLCSSDNVINVVREIGLTNSFQLTQYSAYALINIVSPRDQKNVLLGVGSDDSIKVWLNGSTIYSNNVRRRTTGIQNCFLVDLNAGSNLLLIKVCNHGSGGNDDWGMFFKVYLETRDYTISLPR